MVERRRDEGIAEDVRRRIGGRQRDGDHEVGRGKPEQTEDERFALPARQQLLEHRDAALAVGAGLRDAVVDRQRAEQRQQHQDEGGERGEETGGEKRDAGLISERGEVVDAGQAHHLPPGSLVVRGDDHAGFAKPFEEPEPEPALAAGPSEPYVMRQISPRTAAISRSRSLASLNTPSHRATTTEARQLPITLVIVRPMSISVSTPRISVTPSSGRR